LRRDAADPGEIGAGLEMPAISLKHDDAQRRLAAQRIHRRMQADDQLAVIGVIDLRPVERDGGDAEPVDAAENRVVHAQSAFR
jgi:hypothetical protein